MMGLPIWLTGQTPVWTGYAEVGKRCPNQFAMRRVTSPEEIFPVFQDLFSANGVTG